MDSVDISYIVNTLIAEILPLRTAFTTLGLAILYYMSMNNWLLFILVGCIASSVNNVFADEIIMVVLDASARMKQNTITGNTRMSVAQESLIKTLKQVNPDAKIGLRVYGGDQGTYAECGYTRLIRLPASNAK